MRKRQLLGLVSAMVWSQFAGGQVTTWTNQSGDNLWSEPANWSNGVPSATVNALVSTAGAQIDLGGMARPVGVLRLNGVGVSSIGNGTLILNELASTNSASATIQAAIRSAGQELRIATQPTSLITGDVNVGTSDLRIASAGIAGDLRTTGTIRFWQGFARLLNGNETDASQIDVRRGTLFVEDGGMISQSTPIRITDGSLNFFAPTNAVRLGAIELGSGTSIVASNAASPTTAMISAVSLTRQDFATLVLTRSVNADLRLRFDTPIPNLGGGTLVSQVGVVPWAVARSAAGGGDYAITTYDAGPNANDPSDDVGLRALDSDLEQRANISGALSLDNVRLIENSVVNVATDVQSLAMSASAGGLSPSLNLRLNAPLTVHSGAILGSSTAGANNLRINQIDGTGTLIVPGAGYVGSIADFVGTNRLYIMAPMQADRIIARGTIRLEDAHASKIVSHGGLTIGTAVADEITIQSGGLEIRHGGTSAIRMEPAATRMIIAAPTYSAPIHFDLPTSEVNVARSFGAIPQSIITSVLTGGGSISFSLRHDGDATWTSGSFSSGGVLQINGTWRMSDAEMVLNLANPSPNPRGELQGRGSFLGDVVGGIIDPGAPIGRLTIESFSAGGTPSELRFMLTGPQAGAEYDQLRVLEAISFDENFTTLRVQTDFWTTPAFGDSYTLIDNQGSAPILGHFIGLPEGGAFLYGALKYQVSYFGGDGNDLTVTVVPEPSLSLTAAAAIAMRRRRIEQVDIK